MPKKYSNGIPIKNELENLSTWFKKKTLKTMYKGFEGFG